MLQLPIEIIRSLESPLDFTQHLVYSSFDYQVRIFTFYLIFLLPIYSIIFPYRIGTLLTRREYLERRSLAPQHVVTPWRLDWAPKPATLCEGHRERSHCSRSSIAAFYGGKHLSEG